MNTSGRVPRDEPSTHLVTIGPGWMWPATLVSLLIILLWVPGHHPATDGFQVVVAGVATTYVLGMSVVGSRLVGGLVLRAGGARDPIILLGRGVDPIPAETIGARWRLAAIAASTVTSFVVAGVAAGLAVSAPPATYGHAIAVFSFGANLALAAGVLLPAPGFQGWAVLLAVVDALGVPSDRRIRQAARFAQIVSAPSLMAIGTAGALLGDAMLMILGFMLALVTWTRADLAAGQDAAVQFLACHTAGDLSRPITSHIAPDQSLDDLFAVGKPESSVSLVQDDRGVHGAIGPRQIGSRGWMSRGDSRCGTVMVPMAALRPIGEFAPAREVLPELARNGFALIRCSDGLGYVEATGMGGQIRVWLALRERRRPRGRAKAPSEVPTGTPVDGAASH